FQGAVKRHGFAGAPKTHGHKHDLRRVGSIGSGFPERVWKGRKMPGRMGGETVTIKNVEVVKIDKENKLVAIKGAIPGAIGTMVKIKVV
ncbi:MAG: 50S ribosomal protein L3, partial [Candidatus Portnoybacteria bacterium]|nr:50S ribosomal protein L3 [Candidatus Portnoybacteria bacterium]